MERDEAALELLRARSGLAIDSEGRFLHRGEEILHERTLLVLWRSLTRMLNGRWRVAIGRETAYVTVDETPWVVRAILPHGGDAPFLLRLAGGEKEPLFPQRLFVSEDGSLRYRLASGDLARFSRAAQVALGLEMEEDPPGSERYFLSGANSRWRI